MKEKFFKLKIFVIFTVLTVVLFSLAFYILNIKYKQLTKNSTLLYSAKMITSISNLLQSMQLERGLSSGYIIIKDGIKYKTRLLKQQKITDKDYKKFLFLIAYKKEIYKFIQINNIKKIADIKQQMKKINLIRKKVFSHSISFMHEFNYYTSINTNLLDILRNLTMTDNEYNDSNTVIYDIQALKEISGKGRAYIYNYILSHNSINNIIAITNKLISKESMYRQDFFIDTNKKCMAVFNHTVNKKLQQKINTITLNISKNKQIHCNANLWFQLDTKLINQYKTVSSIILNAHLTTMKNLYNNAKITLIVIIIILFFSSILILILLYFLYVLMKNEEKSKIELKILSYMFDSNEAMIITNAKGDILRVNHAFTKINGYTQDEAFNKNPRILKSNKHSKAFYKNMWNSLITKGFWKGEIYNKRKNGEIFPEQLSITAIKNDHGDTINYIANFIDISELKRAKDDATYQAYHDFLTKLPNRKFMLKKLADEFQKAKKFGFTHAFLFIDLDGFKKVNDTFGHEIGDKLLMKVSYRLKQSIREDDFVARLGGDEFAVILLNLDQQNARTLTQAIATKIIKRISKIFQIHHNSIQIGASIGIEIFPNNLDNIDLVINNADTAMYKAKKNGKNQCIFYL